jgi:hypothetical protein
MKMASSFFGKVLGDYSIYPIVFSPPRNYSISIPILQ